MDIKPLPTHLFQNERIVIPVLCPTRDHQGLVAQSVVCIWNTLWIMGREPIYVQNAADGYSFVRNGVFNTLRQTFKQDTIRGLMIDDDILITDQQALADAILTADKWHWNFVSPYRAKDGKVVLCNADASMMTVEEYSKLGAWDQVPLGGLGFYYGDIPLTYKFHEGGPRNNSKFIGEDLNFFVDNPQLKIRQVDLGLLHVKSMPLGLKDNFDVATVPNTVKEAA